MGMGSLMEMRQQEEILRARETISALDTKNEELVHALAQALIAQTKVMISLEERAAALDGSDPSAARALRECAAQVRTVINPEGRAAIKFPTFPSRR